MSILQRNKKAAAGIGVAALAVAAIALGTGTYAAFQDTEAGPGGTLAAGTLDLTVGDSKSALVLDAKDIAPGYQSATSAISFRNSGSIPGNLSLAFTADNLENGCNEAEAEFDKTCTDPDGELGDKLIVAIEGPGLSYTGPIKSIPAISQATLVGGEKTSIATYKLFFTLPADTGNEVQSDSVKITSTATLVQK